MKLIGIDTDALTKQAEILRKELADIDAVLRIVSGNGTCVQAMPEPLRPPIRVAAPVQIPQPKAERQIKNGGARKAIILALHTGPSGIGELARALVWDAKSTRNHIYGCKYDGLVSESSGGVYALTESGRQQANWHISNPGYQNFNKARGGNAKSA